MDEHDQYIPPIEEPCLKREFTREIAEHETLISWNGDVHAEMFEAWWNTKGFKLFAKWTETHAEEFAR